MVEGEGPQGLQLLGQEATRGGWGRGSTAGLGTRVHGVGPLFQA